MSDLVAIAYDDVAAAQGTTETLAKLAKEQNIALDDVVIVEHKQDGKVKLHQSAHLAALGAAGGAVWGGLIGLLFLQPLLGMAVGAASGAAGGALTDTGVDDSFMKELGQKLPPGGAALFVLFSKVTPDKVLPEIAEHGGHVLQTSLSSEQEEALEAALEGTPAAS